MANWNPSIEIEGAKGTREVLLKTHHLTNGKIFLNGEITYETAQDFLEQMMYLEECKEKVTLIINSPGGEVNAGLMIYDILSAAQVEVDVYCIGMAASMAAIIFSGGKKGHRFIFPHSKVMIHEPMLARGLGGSATSIHNISKSILETRDITNGLLAKHTGKTLEQINECTSYDNYMNAEEAVAFGICDQIVTHI